MSLKMDFIRTWKNFLHAGGISLALLAGAGGGTVAVAKTPTEIRPALLVSSFIKALETYGNPTLEKSTSKETQMWISGFKERGVDPFFIKRRLNKAKAKHRRAVVAGLYPWSADPFAAYRYIQVEKPQTSPLGDHSQSQKLNTVSEPLALHAFRLDVIEDYDDIMNDDVYGYFIVTHDDLLWGKVTSIYRNMDEGTSVFLSPEDRGLFGPKGDKLIAGNHLIIDFGLIESDGEDIRYLQRVSDAIVDLAIVAVTVYNPEAGIAAAQAREETKNLLRLVVELDDDDRLVTDTLRFTSNSLMSMLNDQGSGSLVEFDRLYDRETTFTHFTYRLNFRLFK
jgi:hypothetical protein